MNERVLREQLVAQLKGGQAYRPVSQILAGFPLGGAGVRVDDAMHTAWELLEHLRIAQWDILQFSTNPDHTSPSWPDEYWPRHAAPESSEAWDVSVDQFLSDLDQVIALAESPDTELYEQIPHGTGQTFLREVLLVADHNAHHLGQLMMLRRALER